MAQAKRDNAEPGDDLLDAEGLTDVSEFFENFSYEIKRGWSLRAQLCAEVIARRLRGPLPVIAGHPR